MPYTQIRLFTGSHARVMTAVNEFLKRMSKDPDFRKVCDIRLQSDAEHKEHTVMVIYEMFVGSDYIFSTKEGGA